MAKSKKRKYKTINIDLTSPRFKAALEKLIEMGDEIKVRQVLNSLSSDKEVLKYFAETTIKGQTIEKVVLRDFPEYVKHLKWLSMR